MSLKLDDFIVASTLLAVAWGVRFKQVVLANVIDSFTIVWSKAL